MTARFAHSRLRLACLIWAIFGLVSPRPAAAQPDAAERPSAMKLFPEETLVFVRMANAKEFGERLRETATGRMLRDPQLEPLVADLYGKAGEAYSERAEAIMGVTWDDLQKLPTGEVAFGIVARPGLMPAFLLLVDQGDEPSAAEKLLGRALDFAEERGGEFSTEKIGDVEVTVVRDSDRENRMFGVFQRENTIVAATDADVLRRILWHWDHAGEADAAADSSQSAKLDGADTAATADAEDEPNVEAEVEFDPGRTFAENSKFSSILRHCRRPQDPPPHVIGYIDPIGLVSEFGRDNPGAQFARSFLPQLGIDGLLAVGATMTFATGPFDDLSHFHVLLENPRAGVMQLVTFEPGETAPQQFIPAATENYFTAHWNAGVFYDRLQELIDKMLGAGTFQKQGPEKISEVLGVDFRTAVVDNLAGRFTLFSGYEKPAHFRSQKYTLAAALVDEAAAAETLRTVIDKHPELFEERSFGSFTYHAITPDWWKQMEEEERPFNPFVAVMDGHLFVGGSFQLFEQVIAARDGTIGRLVDSADYARIVATLGRETAGTTPAMSGVFRSEEGMRHIYDLLTSEKTREFIEARAEESPLLAKLAEALEAHQLPPFETLLQYMGPGGGILYDTDSGYHAITFTLRNVAAE